MPTKKSKQKSKPRSAYVEPNKEMLGDKHLDPVESVHRLREEIIEQESNKRLWRQDELADQERSEGPRLNWTDLLRRLQKLNHGIQVRDGLVDDKGVKAVSLYLKKRPDEYTPEEIADPLAMTPPNGVFFLDHRYIGGFMQQEMSEWGHVLTDNTEVAVRERRGWRSVLMTLIQSCVITYAQAVKEFGEPKFDKRATFWNEEMQEYRSI
jgi:hypothetical protein